MLKQAKNMINKTQKNIQARRSKCLSKIAKSDENDPRDNYEFLLDDLEQRYGLNPSDRVLGMLIKVHRNATEDKHDSR